MIALKSRLPFFISILLFQPLTSHAAEYRTTVLYANYGGYMGYHMSSNGKAAWSAYLPPDYINSEIFFHDGTHTRRLTENAVNDFFPKVNNQGQVVWVQTDSGSTQVGSSLMYFNGTSIRLLSATCANWELGLQISDDGSVIWIELTGNTGENQTPLYRLYHYNGLVTRKLSDTAIVETDYDSYYDWGRNIQLNDRGQVLWYDSTRGLCLFDGTRTKTLTASGIADYILNNAGQVVWQDGQRIFLFNGTATVLVTEENSAWCPRLNDQGTVAWRELVGEPYNLNCEIFLYENGRRTRITDNSRYDDCPKINNSNQVAWVQYYEDAELNNHADMMLSTGGAESRLNSGLPIATPRMFVLNDQGQVAWLNAQADPQLISQSYSFFTGSETFTLRGNRSHDKIYLSDNGRVFWAGYEGDPQTAKTNLYLAKPFVTTSRLLSPMLHLLLHR